METSLLCNCIRSVKFKQNIRMAVHKDGRMERLSNTFLWKNLFFSGDNSSISVQRLVIKCYILSHDRPS